MLLGVAGIVWGLVRVPPPPTPAARVDIALRPTWPHGWAGRAIGRAGARDFSPGFEYEITTARLLGPSERKLRASLARLDVVHWPQLNAQMREDAMADIRFVLETQPRDLLFEAFRLHREALVCGPAATDIPAVVEVCGRFAGLRKLCDRPGDNLELRRWCLVRNALPVRDAQ
jgi:hypothetical protein